MRDRIGLDEVIAQQLRKPEVRAEYERNAVADAVAVWLTVYRADHNLSQAELAARSGLSQPAIARLEAGNIEPKLSTLLRLADALGEPLSIRLAPANADAVAGPRVVVTSNDATLSGTDTPASRGAPEAWVRWGGLAEQQSRPERRLAR